MVGSAVELAPPAYGVLFMHCAKFPHRTCNGLLLGSADASTVTVREALPLFHSSLAVAPMLEAALLLADEYCAASNGKLRIVGYYQANEVVDDLDLGPFGKKIADKIRTQSEKGNSATLVLDGKRMQPTVGDLRLVSIGADGKRGGGVEPPTIATDAAAAIKRLETCLSKSVHHDLVDFDNHLDVSLRTH